MEENNFEKQISQEMAEFTVQPSEDVWNKIEARIEKKKRSRLVLILIFLLFCIILSGGYWLWNSGQQRVVGNKNYVKKNAATNIDKETKQENYNSKSKSDSAFNAINQTKNSIVSTEIKKTGNKKLISQHKSIAKFYSNTTINSSEKKSVLFSEKENVSINNPGKTENEINDSKQEGMQKNDSEPAIANDSSYEKINLHNLSKSLSTNDIERSNDTSIPKKSIPKLVQKPAKNKWKTGILFSGGVSNIGNSVLDINSASSYYSYDPGLNNATPGTGQGTSHADR